jgi:hypothetical protein
VSSKAPQLDGRAVQARRLLGVAAGGLGALLLIGGVSLWFLEWRFYPIDTLTYYLAGTRLNAGHLLYDLGPGDPWYAEMPEYPLFSPPFIAVAWRPLAAIPGQLGMLIWIVSMAFAATYAVIIALIGTRGWAGLLVAALTPSLVLLIGVGNVDALVLLGTIGAWRLIESDHDREAGLALGVLASLKLTPAILIFWLLVSTRWRATAWAVLAVAVCLLIAMLGTSPDIYLRYLRVIHEAAGFGNPWALGALIVGFVSVWALRARPSLSFVVAVMLMPLGSPVTAIHSWSVLLGASAPWIKLVSRARGSLNRATLVLPPADAAVPESGP